MLIEFSVENFRSIKNEARLSLVANDDETLRDTNVTVPPLSGDTDVPPLLRSAALYGPNASGKTNIIKSLKTMQAIVLQSFENRDCLRRIQPFKLSHQTKEKPTHVEIMMLAENVRYQYGFSATKEQIYDEWLYAFPQGCAEAETWFTREYSGHSKTGEPEYDYTFKPLSEDTRVWERSTRANALLLSTAIQFNSQALRPLFHWFEHTLQIPNFSNPIHLQLSTELCQQDASKHRVLDFLKAADSDIADIQIEEPPQEFIKILEEKYAELPEKYRGFKIPPSRPKTLHLSDDGASVPFDLRNDESNGTQQLYKLAAPWLNALEKGHILVIDELHAHLHPLLVTFLVQQFHDKAINLHGAQLFFSTHDTSVLRHETLLRRDQIWFCDKDKSQATRLYPATDFHARQEADDNIEKNYLSGRYGGLPCPRAPKYPPCYRRFGH